MCVNLILIRDLKPENCLYCVDAKDSPIKVADFGLSLILAPGEARGIDKFFVGTPGYVAPEVVKKLCPVTIPFMKRKYEYTAAR